MTADAVRQALHQLRQRDRPSHGGRTFADSYDSGIAEADALGREVLASFASTDGRDPAGYPSLARMEQELVLRAAALLDAPPDVVGNVTSGGTESALLAVRTARDAHPELSAPTMVLPTSAAPAFHRAAATVRVEPVFVDIDPRSGRADPVATAQAITDETVLVVVSAPSYPHGVIDPVSEIAAAAATRGVRCHVDAGVAGWLLAYLARELPAYTFAAPGVTSISVDLHTYAYAPKGASILLHRTPELRRPQLSATAAWPGYPLVNTTALSTKSGGALAAAWAVTRFLGDSGYARLAAVVDSGMATLLEGLDRTSHLRVVAEPDAALLAVAADEACDVFTVCDELASRGWYVQPQLSFRGSPATIHLTLSAATVPRVPEFLDALRSSVKSAVAAGPVQLPATLVAAVRTLDLRQLDNGGFEDLLKMAGFDASTGLLPDREAPVSAVLDAASPPVREALMLAFYDRINGPRR